MRKDVEELSERSLNFAAAVVKLSDRLPRTPAGRLIADQLLRAGTSGPANYAEACVAESRADFIHKMHISLKEFRESCFWLRLIIRSDLVTTTGCEALLQEAQELTNICAKSVMTAKSNRR